MKVAAIIPAYNEAPRIGRVLDAALRARLLNEVIVVDDGSADGTGEVAREFDKVKVIRLPRNQGKGAAIAHGVAATDADILVFIDADLIGLQPHHIDAIAYPVISGLDMCVGVFRKGRFWTDAAQAIAPFISGQRAVRRELIEQIPWIHECRSGVEVAINQTARRRKMLVKRVILKGVTHACKERKFGFVKGTAQRARMYAEIGKALVKSRRRLNG